MAARLLASFFLLLFALHPVRAQTSAQLPEPDEVVPDTSFGQIDFDLELRTLEGDVHTFEAYRGNVLFVNFWASWCAPCLAEMSGIDKLRQRISNSHVEFLMVSVDDEADDVTELLQKQGAEWPVFMRGWNRGTGTFRGIVIPRTYIVAKDGRIAYRHTGAADWNTDAIYSFLVRLSEE